MTKITSSNLNYKNQIVDLDEEQSSNISGGVSGNGSVVLGADVNSWHTYYDQFGRIRDSVYETDGKEIPIYYRPQFINPLMTFNITSLSSVPFSSEVISLG
jgi:hypothetical protein